MVKITEISVEVKTLLTDLIRDGEKVLLLQVSRAKYFLLILVQAEILYSEELETFKQMFKRRLNSWYFYVNLDRTFIEEYTSFL